VPATLVYALSIEEQKILEPVQKSGKGELDIHLIGSTYLYEGLSDWALLARSMPAYVHTANVHLILGTPFQNDGPIQDKEGKKLLFAKDLPDEQVKMLPAFLQVKSQAAPYTAKELREKVCRKYTHAATTVVVHCHEKLYQNVMKELPTPHMAFMANPGFPLPFRRAYDGVLLHLLENSIPSVISAQQVWNPDDASLLVSDAGEPHALAMVQDKMKHEQWADEAYQCEETVKAYGSQVRVEAAPFPYSYKVEDQEIVKNSVVEFFCGRAPGSPAVQMAALPEDDTDQWSDDDGDLDDELAESLKVQVSAPFAQSMSRWAASQKKQCVGANTESDWLRCCKEGC